jgi:DNA-binding response OmpR family regulator
MKIKYPGLKFIFMTGHGSQDDYAAGSAETGADYYLLKPVNIEELMDKMTNLMDT